MSSGAAPVDVPNVVGRTESEATDVLQNAGFPRQVVRVDLPATATQAEVVRAVEELIDFVTADGTADG